MSQYVKLNLGIRHSAAADYDVGLMPDGYSNSFELSSKKVIEFYQLAPTTTGITVALPASLTAIDQVLIFNSGATYDILARVNSVIASKTFETDKLGFTATAPCTITDDDSTFLSALYFRAGMYAVVSGATEAANSGTFLVQVAAAGTLTLDEAEALTLDADDVGTPTIKAVQENNMVLAVNGGMCVVTDVLPGSNLVLTGLSGTGECDIIIIGS